MRRAAALNRIIANDPFDQQLEAVLSPALGPLLSAIGRTPAISNAIAAALNDNSAAVSHLARPLISPCKLATLYDAVNPEEDSRTMNSVPPGCWD